MSKKPKVKYQPSDTELLDWFDKSSCKMRFYNNLANSPLDDGNPEEARWNVYNYRIGRGSNGHTAREALTLAWRADTMPPSKVVVSLEKARSMMLKNGVILGDASEQDLERLRRWAIGRIGTKTIVAACTTLLNYHERMRNES
jgi:uncharacterized DUF497 family protein